MPLFLGQRTIDDDSRHWPRAEKERIVAAAVEPGRKLGLKLQSEKANGERVYRVIGHRDDGEAEAA
jgi:transposase-like protein